MPTMIAGIYGMNFDYMPELRLKYAYFVVLGVMVLACTVLYRLFKRITGSDPNTGSAGWQPSAMAATAPALDRSNGCAGFERLG